MKFAVGVADRKQLGGGHGRRKETPWLNLSGTRSHSGDGADCLGWKKAALQPGEAEKSSAAGSTRPRDHQRGSARAREARATVPSDIARYRPNRFRRGRSGGG